MSLQHFPSSAFGFRSTIAVLTGISVLLAGCTTLRSVPVPSPGQSTATVGIKVGDKVRVVTKSGEELRFKVTAVGPETLAGNAPESGRAVQVKFQEIRNLQIETLNKTRTTAAVVAVVVVVAAGIIIANGGIMGGWGNGPLFPPGRF